MPPPPPTSIASRPFAGPALRAQSDRRLVALVRDGYENAFEEIVRRYGKPLGRYAAAIVTSNRAEDVTQDAFSKALLALRDTDMEIELRPWLYRIVRNTALNDLRDQPPPTAQLHENIDRVETPLDAAERREEINELVRRLRALPDAQRAAIVMRELEGLSHEEIAAALGMTGGGARQAIHRARRTLRDSFGMVIPVPVLHFLLTSTLGGAATGAGLGGAAAGAGVASAGGAGAGVAVKTGLATALVAGSVATGVALHDSSGGRDPVPAAEASQGPGSAATAQPGPDPIGDPGSGTNRGENSESGHGRNESEQADDHGDRGSGHEGGERDGESHSGPGGGGSGGDGSDHSGPGGGEELSGSGSDSSGPGPGGEEGSGDSSGPGSGSGDELLDSGGSGPG